MLALRRAEYHGTLEQVFVLHQERSRAAYDLPNVTSYGVALIYAGLGEPDHAFAWLQKALEERTHWLVWLKLDPRRDGLCADPRFVDLQRRVGLLPSAAVGAACP
jgi:hypothetical protein